MKDADVLIVWAMSRLEQASAMAFSPDGWIIFPREVGEINMGDETGQLRMVVTRGVVGVETLIRMRGRRVRWE